MLISFLPVVIISFFGWFMVHLFNFIQVKSCISGWGPHNGASDIKCEIKVVFWSDALISIITLGPG